MSASSSHTLAVVQVVNTLAISDGGPARNSFELNKALNHRPNCHSDLFWVRGGLEQSVLFGDGALAGDLPSPGPRALSLRTNIGRRKVGVVSFAGAMLRADVLIIHGYYLPWVPIIAILGKVLGCRIYLMPHGSLTARQQKYGGLKKLIFGLTFGWIINGLLDAFVTGTKVEAEELEMQFGDVDIKVAGVGVTAPDRKRPYASFHNPVRLLSISRIAPKKRIDLAIDAVGELHNRGISVCLRVAGGGDPRLILKLKRKATELGVEDRIDFVGQLSGDKKVDAFCSSDVFLLPSEDENFGIGFAEATAFGVPTVVSSRVAAAVGLPTEAGVVLENPTGNTIADAILSLLDEERYFVAQTASSEFASSNFSWDAAAVKWINVIND